MSKTSNQIAGLGNVYQVRYSVKHYTVFAIWLLIGEEDSCHVLDDSTKEAMSRSLMKQTSMASRQNVQVFLKK